MEAVKAQLSGVYQIWYNEQTRKQVVDAFTPFHNPKLSEFFENEVIRVVVDQGKHNESDWFGVLSPEFFLQGVRRRCSGSGFGIQAKR